MFNNDKSANEIIEKMKQVDINAFTDVIPVSRGLLETAIAVAISDRDAYHESRRKSCVGAVLGAVEKAAKRDGRKLECPYKEPCWSPNWTLRHPTCDACSSRVLIHAASLAASEWEKDNPMNV